MKEIKLTKGMSTFVDDDDYEKLSMYNWMCSADGYAVRWEKPRKCRYVYLHKEILQARPGFVADHVNGDKLLNIRSNLREATPSQNSCNRRKADGRHTSVFKGVYYASTGKTPRRWRATIAVNYRDIYIGCFATEVEAALAYNEAALKHHGEFARLNHIPITP